MELRQLRYFARVAALRSISKAASELRVAQPALTRQIRLLEQELGVKLLLRHSRGVEPTDAGLALMHGSETMLQGLEALRDKVLARGTEPTGVVRLGFPPSVGMLLVGSLVPRFRALFPGVYLQLYENYSQVLREWLLLDRVDLAVTSEFGSSPALTSTPLFDEELWIVQAPGTPPWPVRPVPVQLLAGLPLIQTDRTNNLRVLLEHVMAERGAVLDVVIEAEALPVIKELVRSGVGGHVSPYAAVVQDIDAGRLAGAPLQDVCVRRVLQWRAARPLSWAMEEMAAAVIRESKALTSQHHPSVRKCSFPSRT